MKPLRYNYDSGLFLFNMIESNSQKNSNESAPHLRFRKARLSDVVLISEIIRFWAMKDQMLPRDDDNIASHIREFSVCVDESDAVVGCGALHIYGINLAEVRSLAVKDGWIGRGVGQDIVSDLLREAAELGLKNVFALTYSPKFFERLDFKIVENSLLPHKIWKDCLYCSKFNDCKEIAVLKTLK